MADKFGPFWIGYKPFNGDLFDMLADVNNIVENPVDKNDLHLTLYYSGDNKTSSEWPMEMNIITSVTATGFGLLGEALVMFVEPSKVLLSRFNDLKSKYPTTFPEWIPHITIGYRSNKEELRRVYTRTEIGKAITKGDHILFTMVGEVLENVGNPDKGADEASFHIPALSDTASQAEYSFYNRDEARKSKVEKMMGRGGLLKSFNTRIARSAAITKAWDGEDFNAFRAECIAIMNNVKKDWDAKNEALAEEREKGKDKK